MSKLLIESFDVRKTFRSKAGELEVLKGISLSVSGGEMLGIVGVSGAGKSTFLHILGGLDRPTSGQIMFRGQNLNDFNENGLAHFRNSNIGFVFQFHHLLPEFSTLENVIMPGIIAGIRFDEIEEKAYRLLSDLGLKNRIFHRPGELSGGEQQRVAVARALIQSPDIVLADEPTGNLDTGTGRELFDLLLHLNQTEGITFIVVTHNETIAAHCDRIVEMTDGFLHFSKGNEQ